jgi:hypothetical protein
MATAIDAASLSVDLSVSVDKAPAGWSDEATVVRSYLAEYALEDLDYARCSVIPAEWNSEAASRGARQEVYGIDVVLQSRPADLAARDALMLLAEEINQLFEHTKFSGSGAAWIRVERTPLFERESFDEAQMLATSSRHSFLVIRSVS